MSPSEVIIEVYIMPEYVSAGAFFSFSLKTLFLYHRGGGKSLQTVSFVSSRPGYTAWLLCALTVGEREEAGSGVSISSRFLFAPPQAPFTTGVLPAKASLSHPKPGPKGSSFSLLMDEGII